MGTGGMDDDLSNAGLCARERAPVGMLATVASRNDRSGEPVRCEAELMSETEVPDSEDAPVVPDEVRLQLIEIAATALGKWAQDEIPRPLRPIARFTPTKRARQGAVKLWLALTDDADFRASIADLTEKAMPELAAQVREDAVPEDADRLAVGVLRYLLRPSGWRDQLAALDSELTDERRRRDVEGELARALDDLARARATIEDLRHIQASGEPEDKSRIRALEADVVRLKKEIRFVKGALSKAESLAGEAERSARQREAELVAARDEALAAARDSEARASALSSDLDAARRGGRADRDFDEVRLWLLVEQLSSAADGLRGMGLARDPGTRPADAALVHHGAVEGRLSVLDDVALDKLLRGQHVHLILDGYNLTKTAWPDLPLADQRNRLITNARALAQRRDVEVSVVFDGQGSGSSSVPTAGTRHFRVRFSAREQLADDLIRELLALEPPGRTVIVASSDKEVAASARHRRAWSVTAETMLDRLARG